MSNAVSGLLGIATKRGDINTSNARQVHQRLRQSGDVDFGAGESGDFSVDLGAAMQGPALATAGSLSRSFERKILRDPPDLSPRK